MFFVWEWYICDDNVRKIVLEFFVLNIFFVIMFVSGECCIVYSEIIVRNGYMDCKYIERNFWYIYFFWIL